MRDLSDRRGYPCRRHPPFLARAFDFTDVDHQSLESRTDVHEGVIVVHSNTTRLIEPPRGSPRNDCFAGINNLCRVKRNQSYGVRRDNLSNTSVL